ncbi:MAG: hypothetical protein ACYTE8_10235 [Planctomycetota bacterium]|jgi:hypothetical protein
MKKKGVLLCALVMLCACTVVHAQEGELHGAIGSTYNSKYVWRGFAIFEGKGGAHPFLNLDLYGTGFGVNVTANMPLSGGYVNGERWDYNLYYRNTLLAGETLQTDYVSSYVYYNYPDHPRKGTITSPNAALQELNTLFSWPNLIGGGWTPRYVLVKLWPSESGSFSGSNSPMGGTASGWAHIFMLDYAMPIMCPVTNEERILNWHSEVIYNDGVGPVGQNVDNDWSNAVFGVSTDIALMENVILTPAIYYQVTMEHSLNMSQQDYLWGGFTLKHLF